MHGGHVTTAFEEYARSRIDDLAQVCMSADSSVEEIRNAQAGIRELRLIAGLRDRIKMQWESGNEPA